jgi:hypothetical protein
VHHQTGVPVNNQKLISLQSVDLAFSSHAPFEKRDAPAYKTELYVTQGLGLLCSVHRSPTLQLSTQTRKPIIFKQNFVTFASSQHTTHYVHSGCTANALDEFMLHYMHPTQEMRFSRITQREKRVYCMFKMRKTRRTQTAGNKRILCSFNAINARHAHGTCAECIQCIYCVKFVVIASNAFVAKLAFVAFPTHPLMRKKSGTRLFGF